MRLRVAETIASTRVPKRVDKPDSRLAPEARGLASRRIGSSTGVGSLRTLPFLVPAVVALVDAVWYVRLSDLRLV